MRFSRVPSVALSPPLTREPAAVRPTKPATFPASGLARESPIISALFVVLCIYLMSGYANDLSMRLLGSKAYISLIAGALLPVLLLASGNILRGLSYPLGRFWAAFYLWLMFATAFSIWRGGSFAKIQEFGTKHYSILFYIAACVTTFHRQVRLMYVCIVSLVIVLLCCFAFGAHIDGRFSIPGSIFFDNSNDLALYLVVATMQAVFLFYSPSYMAKVIGIMLLGASTIMIFRTGSRASFLALVVCYLTALLIHRRRAVMVVLVIPVMIAGLAFTPSAALKRMVNILWSVTPEAFEGGDAEMSQLERTELLKRSIVMTFENPMFGVGPGQFPEVIAGEARKKGVHTAWLNPHNTYTQISSEAGFPAFIFAVSCLLLAIRMCYRSYRSTRLFEELTQAEAMSFCLLLALVGYSVNSFFHHVAYGRLFAILGGMALTNSILCSQLVSNARSRRTARATLASPVPNPIKFRGPNPG